MKAQHVGGVEGYSTSCPYYIDLDWGGRQIFMLGMCPIWYFLSTSRITEYCDVATIVKAITWDCWSGLHEAV